MLIYNRLSTYGSRACPQLALQWGTAGIAIHLCLHIHGRVLYNMQRTCAQYDMHQALQNFLSW